METTTLRFDDLDPYLLLKNGNYLYRVPYGDGWAVLKIYFDSRGPMGRLRKSFNNLMFGGQTSYQPRTRCRVEHECLALWRRHGFRVFETYEDVEVEAPGCVPGYYLLMEYVERPKLLGYMRDESVPADERFATYRRFLPEWSQRHELAIAEREPRLVHENGDGKHVMLLEDGSFLWFDFEMVYRHRDRVEEHVAHEIAQYLWHTSKSLPPELAERLLEETIEHYPVHRRLVQAHDYFLRHPRPLPRLARFLERRLRARARKPTSKYALAIRLREKLDGR